MTLPDALQPLAAYRQFILWAMFPGDPGKKDKKLPVNYRTLEVCNAHDSSAWMDAATACLLANPPYGIGFVFTSSDPFFFLDIDSCLTPDGWSPLANELIAALPGAAVEISQSGRGIHIIGSGVCPLHKCRNDLLGLELYTEKRFIALTGKQAQGSVTVDCSAYLPTLVAKYFPPTTDTAAQPTVTEWTTGPCPEWSGITDDNELIIKACASTSAGGVFGGRASFAALWSADPAILSTAYPEVSGTRPYNESQADAALAQHLAFWTGKDCERIRRLMRQSALQRDKYDREDYLYRTILKACGQQREVYNLAARAPLPKLKAASEAQRQYAEKIRDAKLSVATPEQREILTKRSITAKFWLDNAQKSLADLCALRTPAAAPIERISEPHTIEGFQYLTATAQLEHFRGCVYVQSLHKIFTPDGQLLKADQFNATYGGYLFQLDETGDKTTRKAWEAFTESQVARYPKATGICFRPNLPPGEIVEEEGRLLVNTYVPVPIRLVEGDPGPFLSHFKKILPNQRDRDILLAYMAACVQHIGVKFQWAPLVQGVEGNGKTLLTRCMSAALGKQYVHYPKAADIDNKFNGWLAGKLFIGVEDIYVPHSKAEVIETLKPMITAGDGIEVQFKGVDQITAETCANFMLNSNHKDALKKTRNDRRFCIFYCAQQTFEDLKRDGMTGDYFPKLYEWLRLDGYAIVSNYLKNYEIPDELNPATKCHRAPVTSSTNEALLSSLGNVEQEIIEAVEEGRPGFAGGWISSVAIDRLLNSINSRRIISPNKRRELLQSIGYDWHPGLKDGRVNNPILIDDGKKPRLFIKEGHIMKNLTNPAEIVRNYQEAQGVPSIEVTDIFKKRA